LVLLVCVGGPTAAIWVLIEKLQHGFRDMVNDQQQAQGEWSAVAAMWDAPPADTKPDTLLPPAFGNNQYRLLRTDDDVADAELGITLPGRRGIYAGPDGEVEVRLYRCPEAEAKAIEKKVYDLAHAAVHGTPAVAPDSKRRKAYLATQDSNLRAVTYSFHDGSNEYTESGKLWYAGGWLFWFRTGPATAIETFPPKYLIEVARRAGARGK
jgi:hypothetical protein